MSCATNWPKTVNPAGMRGFSRAASTTGSAASMREADRPSPTTASSSASHTGRPGNIRPYLPPSEGWASLSSGSTTQLWVPGLTLFITATSSRFLHAKLGSLYTGRMPHTLSERLGFSDAVEDADHRLPRGDHRHATRK